MPKESLDRDGEADPSRPSHCPARITFVIFVYPDQDQLPSKRSVGSFSSSSLLHDTCFCLTGSTPSLVAGAHAQSEYKVISALDGGTIIGQVNGLGHCRTFHPFPINKDPQVCDPSKRQVPAIWSASL